MYRYRYIRCETFYISAYSVAIVGQHFGQRWLFFSSFIHTPLVLNARMKACTRSTEHGALKRRSAFWYNEMDPFHQFSFGSSILCEWTEYTVFFFWYSRLLRWLIRPTQKYDFWIMYQSHWGVFSVFYDLLPNATLWFFDLVVVLFK